MALQRQADGKGTVSGKHRSALSRSGTSRGLGLVLLGLLAAAMLAVSVMTGASAASVLNIVR
jgi:hypothetical protein